MQRSDIPTDDMISLVKLTLSIASVRSLLLETGMQASILMDDLMPLVRNVLKLGPS